MGAAPEGGPGAPAPGGIGGGGMAGGMPGGIAPGGGTGGGNDPGGGRPGKRDSENSAKYKKTKPKAKKTTLPGNWEGGEKTKSHRNHKKKLADRSGMLPLSPGTA